METTPHPSQWVHPVRGAVEDRPCPGPVALPPATGPPHARARWEDERMIRTLRRWFSYPGFGRREVGDSLFAAAWCAVVTLLDTLW